MKRKDLIRELASSDKWKQARLIRRLGTSQVLPTEVEESIVKWIMDLRSEGIPVTYLMVQTRALEEASDLNKLSRPFKARRPWLKRFFARHRLSLRCKTRQGQKLPVDGARVQDEFSKRVSEKCRTLGIRTIYNADQTAFNYEYLPRRTVNTTNAKTVWVKCADKDKERATVMLLADNSGRKLRSFVVMKTKPTKTAPAKERRGFGPLSWKEVQACEEIVSVRVYGNKTAW
ncbi:hypothetical protein Ae201684P_007499 [Aphanomyces euteiches]|uniref:HTH CENPB-type domain-containing protein n=1 Tax=Aphanomyces euteiches TaxID=100861 RepID=A0A6G0W2C5_9STRA|nr:hypothetical protein Ae201684_019264 [Aphanomyces euteiches]KAH9079823.1 hypothetical protein Ae201684P_007499 [Aphanomyces euteiches]